MTTMFETTAQEWEAAWWGDCRNTFGEEAKQLTYAHRMGLINEPREGKWPVYDLEGRSVVDIGGGPVSMLLKTVNGDRLTVVDPCPYPDWVAARYLDSRIEWVQEPAEMWEPQGRYDEAWQYNVAQHVIDPEAMMRKARAASDVMRVFEWVETETNVGHPHSLQINDLNEWLGGIGTVANINENGAVGLAYWGVFR